MLLVLCSSVISPSVLQRIGVTTKGASCAHCTFDTGLAVRFQCQLQSPSTVPLLEDDKHSHALYNPSPSPKAMVVFFNEVTPHKEPTVKHSRTLILEKVSFPYGIELASEGTSVFFSLMGVFSSSSIPSTKTPAHNALQRTKGSSFPYNETKGK